MSQVVPDLRFCTTQLGYRVGASKRVVVRIGDPTVRSLTVHLNTSNYHHRRTGREPEGWDVDRFPWPFDLLDGALIPGSSNYVSDQVGGTSLTTFEVVAVDSRWGTFLCGTLDFDRPGVYVLESDQGVSLPFEINDSTHDRLQRGYLIATHSQRSGLAIPGVRDAEFADDARRDSDGLQLQAAGGWYDAGDHRKWTSTTVLHLLALTALCRAHDGPFAADAHDELDWGCEYFQQIISEAGQVVENIGGGSVPSGVTIDDWWFDNHSGTTADGSGSNATNNVPGTGGERSANTLDNPNVQFQFVRALASAASVGNPVRAARSRVAAERAWSFGRQRGHDRRTLFVAAELEAAAALRRLPEPPVDLTDVEELTGELLARQSTTAGPLSGYFMDDAGHTDGYRSIAFSCDPPMALLDAIETLAPHDSAAALREQCLEAITLHIDEYLLRSATDNVFGLPPYGVWTDPPFPNRQTFTEFAPGRFVRYFGAPWNRDFIVHGTNGVTMHQAFLLARAGRLLERQDWLAAATRLIEWGTGANPDNMSLFTGIGHRHPVPFCPRTLQVPEAAVIGYIGRPDDTPYVEQSNAHEWSTQEVWGVPFIYASLAISQLDAASNHVWYDQ